MLKWSRARPFERFLKFWFFLNEWDPISSPSLCTAVKATGPPREKQQTHTQSRKRDHLISPVDEYPAPAQWHHWLSRLIPSELRTAGRSTQPSGVCGGHQASQGHIPLTSHNREIPLCWQQDCLALADKKGPSLSTFLHPLQHPHLLSNLCLSLEMV